MLGTAINTRLRTRSTMMQSVSHATLKAEHRHGVFAHDGTDAEAEAGVLARRAARKSAHRKSQLEKKAKAAELAPPA